MNVDYLSADGHKWLLGPEGAGVFYIRRELLESTHPPEIGWNNVVHAQDFGSYDFTFRADAQRYESGTPNVPGFLALHASMQMLMDIGVENISRRIKKLTDQLADGVEAKGYQLISPREGEMWSGSVVFVSPTHDHAAVVAKLRKEHKTEVALREGRIRCSPHIYNTEAQIARFIDVLPGH
jgi:cysteine desulfurase / selenocysteine lyase